MLHEVAQVLSPFLPPVTLPLATYLVYRLLTEGDRRRARRYAIEAIIVVLSTFCLYMIATHAYRDQPAGRTPHQVGAAFLREAGNSFPSHHAIFIALVAALVGLASMRVALPFYALTVIEDAALVVAHYHSVADVAAGDMVVWLPALCLLLLRGKGRRNVWTRFSAEHDFHLPAATGSNQLPIEGSSDVSVIGRP
jgi:membrane-associated phospholipid phosphatase